MLSNVTPIMYDKSSMSLGISSTNIHQFLLPVGFLGGSSIAV